MPFYRCKLWCCSRNLSRKCNTIIHVRRLRQDSVPNNGWDRLTRQWCWIPLFGNNFQANRPCSCAEAGENDSSWAQWQGLRIWRDSGSPVAHQSTSKQINRSPAIAGLSFYLLLSTRALYMYWRSLRAVCSFHQHFGKCWMRMDVAGNLIWG